MDRPKRPAAMDRNIRRRCGFGCVICGLPIYEFHHINGYKDEVGHIEAEITLLCASCHRKERNGIIPREEVVRWDKNPINWQKGESTPERVWYGRENIQVDLGGNIIHIQPLGDIPFFPLLIDGRGVVQLHEENGAWLLSLFIVDPWHKPVVTIDRNNLIYRIAELDIEYAGGRLSMSWDQRVYFAASFQSPVLRIEVGIFCWKGIWVLVNEGGVRLLPNGPQFSGLEAAYCPVGFKFGRDPKNRPAMIFSPRSTRLISNTDNTGWREITESEIPIQPEEVD